jgi:hypothetical protein
LILKIAFILHFVDGLFMYHYRLRVGYIDVKHKISFFKK